MKSLAFELNWNRFEKIREGRQIETEGEARKLRIGFFFFLVELTFSARLSPSSPSEALHQV